MWMKAGAPFIGKCGQTYEKDGLVDQPDVRVALMNGWAPADEPAPEPAEPATPE